MKLFLESQERDLWEIVENGPHFPKVTNEGVETVKPKALWTNDEKARVVFNFVEKHYLTCALRRSEFDKIA